MLYASGVKGFCDFGKQRAELNLFLRAECAEQLLLSDFVFAQSLLDASAVPQQLPAQAMRRNMFFPFASRLLFGIL